MIEKRSCLWCERELKPNQSKYCCRSCVCRATWTGRKHKESTKIKMSENHLDVSGENNPFYGKKHNTDTKELMSKWKTDVDYHMDNLLTPSSPKYRITAFEKYGVKCECCGTERAIFEVHHIDGDHYNDDIKNLVVLCKDCHHTKAHIMTGRGKGMTLVLDENFKNQMTKRRELEELR